MASAFLPSGGCTQFNHPRRREEIEPRQTRTANSHLLGFLDRLEFEETVAEVTAEYRQFLREKKKDPRNTVSFTMTIDGVQTTSDADENRSIYKVEFKCVDH